MQKRDFFLKKNNDQARLFYLRPFLETLWWLVYLLKYIFFSISPNLHIKIRNYFLKRNNSYARDRTNFVKSFYAETTKSYYEIQIKHNTRTCNIVSEEDSVLYKSKLKKNTFIFGIAPLIEFYTQSDITSWSLEINILSSNNCLDSFELHFPLNEKNKSELITFLLTDGWVDLKINLDKYTQKDLSITLEPKTEKLKKRNFKEQFAISNPQFINESKNPKNIILLSAESLSDFQLLSDKYNFKNFPNLDSFISDSSNFNDVYGPAESTLPSLTSLLSGLMSTQHSIGDYSINSDSFDNKVVNSNIEILPETLKSFEFMNFFAATATRTSSKVGFARGFDDHHQVNNNYDLNAPGIDWAIKGLDAYKNYNKFLFLHFDHLHAPVLKFGTSEKPMLHDVSKLNQSNFHILRDYYLKGLCKIDRDIGFLVKYLKDQNQYENTLIILTGDHGNAIEWRKGSDYSLNDERLRVPLIIKYPNWSKKRDEFANDINKSTSSLSKIFETIYLSLDIKISDEFLNLPQYSNEFKEYTFSEVIMMPRKQVDRYQLAVFHENYKYVCSNIIDWENFKITKVLEENLYVKDPSSGYFDENNLETEENNEEKLNKYRLVAKSVIGKNLKFLKKYPSQIY